MTSKNFIYIVKDDGADSTQQIGILTDDSILSDRYTNNSFHIYYCDQTKDKTGMSPFAIPDNKYVLKITIQTNNGGYGAYDYPSSDWEANDQNPPFNNKIPSLDGNDDDKESCFMVYAIYVSFNDDGSNNIS